MLAWVQVPGGQSTPMLAWVPSAWWAHGRASKSVCDSDGPALRMVPHPIHDR